VQTTWSGGSLARRTSLGTEHGRSPPDQASLIPRLHPGKWLWCREAPRGRGAGGRSLPTATGRLRNGGDPWARATEEEVRALFARFDGWAGLAAAHPLRRQPGMVSTTLPATLRSRSASSAVPVCAQSASTPRGTVSRPSATRPASTPRSRPNVRSSVP
jgi:hypothetical protein